MAVTYTWNLIDAEVFPTSSDSQTPVNTKNDVIHTINYNLIASDTVDDLEYKQVHTEAIKVDTSNLTNFTSFDSLDKEVIIGWVTESIKNNSPYPDPVEYLKTGLSGSLAEIINPTSITKFFT
jgi:hypothetical protein